MTKERMIERFESAYPCSARSDWIRNRGKYFCGHPKVHTRDNIVHTRICQLCRYRSLEKLKDLRPVPTLNQVDRTGPCFYLGEKTGETECKTCRGKIRIKTFECLHPEHEETTIKDCDYCRHYDRALRQGEGQVSSWAVGVTTAPRKMPTLERTAKSIVDAGWDEFFVFAEPESDLARLPEGATVIKRGERMGAWGNWLASLAELYLRRPKADAYLIFQDDVLLCKGIRDYLEATLWPQERLGFISIYCPSNYKGVESYLKPDGSGGFVGALAMVFSPQSVRALLSSPLIWTHSLRMGTSGTSGIDTALGYWSETNNLDCLFHYPSLVQHTGNTSAIWENAQNKGWRMAKSFVGAGFDARQLIGEQRGQVSSREIREDREHSLVQIERPSAKRPFETI